MSGASVDVVYLAVAVFFVLALKGLAHPRTAVRGNLLGSLGMGLAVGVTILDRRIVRLELVLLGLVLGGLIGLALGLRVRMRAMPQLVALFNGLGGGASALVAGSALLAARPSALLAAASAVSGLVGTVTFSGSLVAVVKLQEWLRARPRTRALLTMFSSASLGFAMLIVAAPDDARVFGAMALLAAGTGVLLVAPIGGADMPVVVALLNACSGLAAAATGFVLMNQALIISGSLVGASGLILTRIMCRAMNRTLGSVLFAPLGRGEAPARQGEALQKPVKSVSAEEVAMILEASRRVVIVPGYGMAVAQAQHAVSELCEKLEERGVDVSFAIHPVAGRMPGHMNVLLAEADVPYEKLKDLDTVNPEFAQTDVVLVIGANDVVNPSARTDAQSPLYGMPILDADRAKSVVVMKRSLGPGFAGVDNPLFTADNTMMLLGDAKTSVLDLISAL